MRFDRDGAAQELRTGPFDPLADLLFGLVAIIIPIFALLLPAIYMASDAASSSAEAIDMRLMHQDVRVHGMRPRRFLASANGLQVATGRTFSTPLDRMLDDPGLADELARARDADAPVLLLIAPEGFEAAFLFEQMAARAGLGRIFQVRLDRDCTFVRNADLASSCRWAEGARP